jgi:hypothetical protein
MLVMKIRDRLFLETDDSCALCGERTSQALETHHIDGNRENNEYDNQIVLCHNCHKRFHDQKGISREDIVSRKRHLIARTITQYGVNALKIAARNDFGVVAMPFLLYHLVDLGLMRKAEDQMGYGSQEDATALFSITEDGRRVLEQWLAND